LAAALAAVITFGLTYVMQALIKRDTVRLRDVDDGKIVDFVRLKREPQVEPKKREVPKRRRPEKEPPPPEMQLSEVEGPGKLEIAAAPPDLSLDLDLGSGPGTGGQGGDTDPIPVVRVSPQYPARAMQRGIEGWVQLEFTVTAAGTVKDINVQQAEPPNYFEQAAMNAVRKYKYKPRLIDGQPVETRGVRIILSFNLQTG
jgi:protein TonB